MTEIMCACIYTHTHTHTHTYIHIHIYTHTHTHTHTHTYIYIYIYIYIYGHKLCLFVLKYLFMRCDVLMIMLIKIEVLWDVMLCQLVNRTGAYISEKPVAFVIRQ